MSDTKRVYEDSWLDAQKMHKVHPKTFDAPSRTDLKQIKKGFVVKICNGKERFWVIVQSAKNGVVTGEVNNHLVCGSPYNVGDRVKFSKRHIYEILEPSTLIQLREAVKTRGIPVDAVEVSRQDDSGQSAGEFVAAAVKKDA